MGRPFRVIGQVTQLPPVCKARGFFVSGNPIKQERRHPMNPGNLPSPMIRFRRGGK